MAHDNQSDILGKKIFFLHPSPAVQDEIIFELIQQEFESYVVRDHEVLKQVLKRYPDSIVFVDIDGGMSESAWEAWIKDIQADPDLAGIQLGVVSSKNDKALAEKYAGAVKAGYVPVKNVKQATQQLLDVLNVLDAKGRRRFLRAAPSDDATAINFPHNGAYVNGAIKDISSTGFSCSFSEDPQLEKNSLFSDIQIQLQNVMLKLEGIVFGSRMDNGDKVYVVVFTQRINPSDRTQIRKYIQTNIQSKLEGELSQ